MQNNVLIGRMNLHFEIHSFLYDTSTSNGISISKLCEKIEWCAYRSDVRYCSYHTHENKIVKTEKWHENSDVHIKVSDFYVNIVRDAAKIMNDCNRARCEVKIPIRMLLEEYPFYLIDW